MTMNRNYTKYYDFDYMNLLPAEELAWLKKFANEYYLGDFHGENIHKDPKECYNRRNRERRDLMLKADLNLDEIFEER